MPQAIISFDEKEDKKINNLAYEWRLSKHDTVKKIVREFIEKEENNEKI